MRSNDPFKVPVWKTATGGFDHLGLTGCLEAVSLRMPHYRKASPLCLAGQHAWVHYLCGRQ